MTTRRDPDPGGPQPSTRDPDAASADAARTAELNRRWADALVGGVAAAGAEHVVVSPGSRSTALVLAADRRDALRTHVLLDERAAGFAALGIARASGRPVALVCTSGTAAGHYLPAVMEADRSRVPIVVIAADRPPERHGCGAPQTIEQRRLFGGYVRAAIDLGAPSPDVPLRWVGRRVAQALAAATGPRPGPVHLNVAFRKPFWSASTEAAPTAAADVAPLVVRGPPTLGPPQVAELAARLKAARRGLIIGGLRPETEVFRGWPADVAALAAKLGWPVLAEPTSQLRFGAATGAPVVATYEALLRAERWAEALKPDVVLRFGQAPTSRVLADWLASRPGARTILVDGGGEWRDWTITGDELFIAEPSWLCRALAEALEGHAPPPEVARWAETWSRAEGQAGAVLAARAGRGLWEGAISGRVVELLPEGGLLFVASSMPVRDLETFAPTVDKALGVAANRGVNGIDGLVATALGVAIGWGRGPVVGLLGDLGLLHDPDGLLAAAEWCRRAAEDGTAGIDLTLVVLNNGGGGIFEHLPIARHPAFERYFLTPQTAPDIAALCDALSVPYSRVTEPGALRQVALTSQGGLRVVEVVVDRAESRARRRDALAAVGDAVDSPGRAP